jgi:hypothetical protein
MSVDIIRESGEEFCFSNAGWRTTIAFAESHGWSAADPDSESYSAGEMTALASAIESGLAGKTAEAVSDELTRLLVTPSS